MITEGSIDDSFFERVSWLVEALSEQSNFVSQYTAWAEGSRFIEHLRKPRDMGLSEVQSRALLLLLQPYPVFQLAQWLIQVALTGDDALDVLPGSVERNDE